MRDAQCIIEKKKVEEFFHSVKKQILYKNKDNYNATINKIGVEILVEVGETFPAIEKNLLKRKKPLIFVIIGFGSTVGSSIAAVASCNGAI